MTRSIVRWLTRVCLTFWLIAGMLLLVSLVTEISPTCRIGNREFTFGAWNGSLFVGYIDDPGGLQLPILDRGGFRNMTGDRFNMTEHRQWRFGFGGIARASATGTHGTPLALYALFLNLIVTFAGLSLLPMFLVTRRSIIWTTTRRRHRREIKRLRNGLCHVCAYRLLYFQTYCPECGTACRELGPPPPEYSI